MRAIIAIIAAITLAGCSGAAQKKETVAIDFEANIGSQYEVLAHAADPTMDTMLFAANEEGTPRLYFYHPALHGTKPVNQAKALPGVDKITWKDGAFQVWYQGQVVLTVE